MRSRSRDLLTAATIFAVWVTSAMAQDATTLDLFVGAWIADESQRQVSGTAPLIFRQGERGLEEWRGGEINPVVQQVVLDGKPQSAGPNVTMTWRQVDNATFERKITENGQVISIRTLRVSDDGRTLTEQAEQSREDGSRRTLTYVYQRVQGDNGLVGRWEPQSFQSDAPGQIWFERVGQNALRFRNSRGATFTATLDGPPVPQTGPGTIAGTMRSLRMVGQRTLEQMTSRNGKDVQRAEMVVSQDGNTLTVTSWNIDGNASAKPSIAVWKKQ